MDRHAVDNAELLIVAASAEQVAPFHEAFVMRGARVSTATGLAAVHASLDAGRWAVALFDARPAPDGLGPEACRPAAGRRPVVALTLHQDADRVRRLGARSVVLPPFHALDVLEAVVAALGSGPPEASAPVGRVESAPDALAGLPGIDARIGRATTLNNDRLYLRLLGLFRNGQRDFGVQFRAMVERGDNGAARRLAHDLRSVAGSLGAMAVNRHAEVLEQCVLARRPPNELLRQLVLVESALDPVIAGLDTLSV